MSPELILSMAQRMLEMAFMLAAAQIQKMTLSYIPKLIAAYVTIFVFGAWMLNKLLASTKELIINISVWLK